jgi:hypothetical protein
MDADEGREAPEPVIVKTLTGLSQGPSVQMAEGRYPCNPWLIFTAAMSPVQKVFSHGRHGSPLRGDTDVPIHSDLPGSWFFNHEPHERTRTSNHQRRVLSS